MDLHTGFPFWLIKHGLLATFPPLKADAVCDVAVIGGGITGALVAYHLNEAGIDALVVERRDIGGGSTAASTGLLQYEVDTPLVDLIEMVGRRDAERSYLLCLEAILKLEQVVQRVGVECGFQRKKSLYVASAEEDMDTLRREYEARRRIGIKLDFLTPTDIQSRFSFSAPAALLSEVGAQVDPYLLTYALFETAGRRGLRVFDRTTVTEIEHESNGVLLRTERGAAIKAKYVVFAAGYEAQEYLKKQVTSFRATYALVSEPVTTFSGWGEDQCLIWESARPYLYMRTTADGRIMMGGEDDRHDNERARDRRLPKKTATLVKRFANYFEDIEMEPAYAWAGAFGETEDGLAYIGGVKEYPHSFFALGYGGNGITYSLIAAEIIRDAVLGHANADARIFSFDRAK